MHCRINPWAKESIYYQCCVQMVRVDRTWDCAVNEAFTSIQRQDSKWYCYDTKISKLKNLNARIKGRKSCTGLIHSSHAYGF